LRLAANFLKRPATELSILMLLLLVQLDRAIAQHDSLTSNSNWNSGLLTLKDHSTLKGFIQHDEKLRSIKFRTKLDDEDAQSILTERRILSMEYYDREISKVRKFYTWDVEDDGSTIQGPALYEVVMATKNFVVLTRRYGVLPTDRSAKGKNANSVKIEFDKVEKIFLASEGVPGELLWLGPLLEKPEPGSPVSQIKPFFAGEVMKKYTQSHWQEVKSFVKKNRLNLKRKSDLMETLSFYQRTENVN
jgi:hypothetical protein